MNAPPFPLNPTVGQWFGQWVWNGSRWVSGGSTGVRVIITTFDAPGQFPYQPSPGLVTAIVETIGGGGGGGGALGQVNGPPATEAGWVAAGGGGGSGGYSRSAIPAALVLGGVIVTVGAGGTGGLATQETYGGAGGATSFGALVMANGGAGGASNVVTTTADPLWGAGGIRAAPGIGDLAVFGNAGFHGEASEYTPGAFTQTIVFGGQGGSIMFASAGSIGTEQGAGNVGTFGGGGSGGASTYASEPAVGGTGGAGVCVVTEYCWADAGDAVCCNPNTLDVNARVTVAHDWPGPGPCPPGWRGGSPAGFSGDPNAYGFDE
jgi:hypothetical protein